VVAISLLFSFPERLKILVYDRLVNQSWGESFMTALSGANPIKNVFVLDR